MPRMTKRQASRRRWAVAVFPATVITLAAIALAVLVALIPAVTSIEYLAVEERGPGVGGGDLAVLREILSDELRPGDVVAVDLSGDGALRLHRVTGVEGNVLTLTAEDGAAAINTPRGVVALRLSQSIPDLGEAHDYIDSAAGWGTVGGVVVGVWALPLAVLWWQRRRTTAAAPEAEEAPASAAAEPSSSEAAQPSAPRRIVAARGNGQMAAAPAIGMDDPLLALARVVARPAPPHGMRRSGNGQRNLPSERTMRWVVVGAAAALVAGTALLVASEQRKQKAPAKRKKQRRAAALLW